MCQLYKLFSCRSYVSVSCLVIGFVSILDQVLDVYELYNSKVNWLVNDVMNIFLKKMIRTTTSNMNTITKSRTSSGIAFIWGQNEMAQFILVDGRLTNLLWNSITPELINRPNSKASVRNSRGSTMSLVFNWQICKFPDLSLWNEGELRIQVCFFLTFFLSVYPILSVLSWLRVHKSVLYVCVSTAAEYRYLFAHIFIAPALSTVSDT